MFPKVARERYTKTTFLYKNLKNSIKNWIIKILLNLATQYLCGAFSALYSSMLFMNYKIVKIFGDKIFIIFYLRIKIVFIDLK